jgi:hypothetical protein
MFLGVGTNCTQCPGLEEGACCFSDGSCQHTDAFTCASLGGQFHGIGSSCEFCSPQGLAPYTWTISASPTNPTVHITAATFGVTAYYLWLYCCDLPGGLQDGMSAAEFAILSGGPTHLATIPQNGFLNAGSTTNLLLAVAGCPCGPVVAANLLVISLPGTMALAPSSTQTKGTVDCSPNPSLWAINWAGLGIGGVPPPSKGNPGCFVTNLEQKSWAKIKAMYR